MRTMFFCGVTILASLALAQDGAAPAPTRQRPIDFTKVDRTAPKLPQATASARYGIFLFGSDGGTRVWAVLDRSAGKTGFDVLYFDRNADGDLTEPGERFAGRPKGDAADAEVEFVVGDYRPPGSGVTHKDLKITWTAKSGVRFRVLWRGEKLSMGGYGPARETYASFGDSPRTAPVFVPGWDRPFQFERWIAEPLERGKDCEFEVFVGNRGDRTGTFCAVDDKFLPDGEYVVATLQYRDREGKPATAKFELMQRC